VAEVLAGLADVCDGLVEGEAVVVEVTITVDPDCSRGAVGVMLMTRVEMRVVGSAVGAVEVRVMAGSDSGA